MTKRVNCSRELPAPADLKETGKKKKTGSENWEEAFRGEVGSFIKECSFFQTMSSTGKMAERGSQCPACLLIPP